MSRRKLIQAHKWFYDEVGFVWVPDRERLGQPDRWQILPTPEHGGLFRGDCDDAALTVLNRLVELRVNPKKLFIVRCATEKCAKYLPYDHAILGMKEGDDWYFSDNRYAPFPAATLDSLRNYKLYDALSIDNLQGVGKPELFK